MKKLFLLAMLIITTFLPVLSIAQTQENTRVGIVKGGWLHLRAEADQDAHIIATYPECSLVTVLAAEAGWARVETSDGHKEYMKNEYLTIMDSLPDLGFARTTDGAAYINMRSGPGYQHSVVLELAPKTPVQVCEKGGAFDRVYVEGMVGYIDVNFLVKDEEEAFYGEIPLSPFRFDVSALTDRVMDFGESASLVSYAADLSYSIEYPVTGIGTLDKALEEVIERLIAEHTLPFAAQAGAEEEQAAAQMSVQYSAVRVSDTLYSVLLYGWFDSPYLAHPTDVIAALNYDAATDTVYEGASLFKDQDQALSLLVGALTEGGLGEDIFSGDVSWLAGAQLTRSGVAFYLERSVCLPSAFGAQCVILPYDEIARYLAVAGVETEAPVEPSATAFAPEPTAGRVIDPSKPMVALTFDDGPSEHTPRILDLLKEYGANATFCVIGSRCDAYADTIRRAYAEGNEIATHTWNHQALNAIGGNALRRNLARSVDKIKEICGAEVSMVRPPFGSISAEAKRVCKEMGLMLVTWSIDTEDWKTRNAKQIVKNVLDSVQNGSIILCHDLYEETADAMEVLIPELVKRGYQIVSVEQLYSFHQGGVKPGLVYSHLDPKNIVK